MQINCDFCVSFHRHQQNQDKWLGSDTKIKWFYCKIYLHVENLEFKRKNRKKFNIATTTLSWMKDLSIYVCIIFEWKSNSDPQEVRRKSARALCFQENFPLQLNLNECKTPTFDSAKLVPVWLRGLNCIAMLSHVCVNLFVSFCY